MTAINNISNPGFHPYPPPLSRIEPRVEGIEPKEPAVSKTEEAAAADPNQDNVRRTEAASPTGNKEALTPEELRLLDYLKQRDREVRAHEQAHVAAGGRYVTKGAQFQYKRGPDGANYAVGGEVGIDASPVPGDPEATIQKMDAVRRAALAPADPSPQDLAVAGHAVQTAAKARMEIALTQAAPAKETEEEGAEKPATTGKQGAEQYGRQEVAPVDKGQLVDVAG